MRSSEAQLFRQSHFDSFHIRDWQLETTENFVTHEASDLIPYDGWT